MKRWYYLTYLFGLTLTWDVFKLIGYTKIIIIYIRLTLTWDVFKFS